MEDRKDSTAIRHMIHSLLCDGEYWMPHELCAFIRVKWGILVSDSTITAKLRDLRKPQYGAATIEKRIREGSKAYEYRLVKA